MSLSLSLQHQFPGFSLDVSFEAGSGVTALFGRSGAGKTTLVNAVAGLLRPDAGQITLNGQKLFDARAGLFLPPHRRGIGYVFQDARLFPHLTVRQNLTYGRWIARKPPGGPGLDEVVALLGLAGLLERRPAHLSGGEKSRVALGRALLSRPQMLLLDEPLAALDQPRKAALLPYFEQLRDQFALPILYISHSPSEVARLADRVILLDQGRVLAAGPTAEVLTSPASAAGFGLADTAALLSARITGARAEDGLTEAASAAGPLWVTGLSAPEGSKVQLRILARDVMLSLSRPEGISALNILPVTLTDLTPSGDEILVRLAIGPELLLSRITPRSAKALNLTPGMPLYAVIKAVSLAAPD